MITDGTVLRPGQGIALRAVQVRELRPDGALVCAAARETPSAELLADTVTRRRLEEELSQRLRRPIRIEVIDEAGAAPTRISPEVARKQRLERLVEGDQDLQQLVDRLDLEIMD